MLTETKIRTAKPREKPYKLFDERGLFMLINPDASRWWRLKYTLAGREKGISLGVYPDVGLKKARERRDEARKLIADGVDPSAKRQAQKLAGADTFEAVAREWLVKQLPGWVDNHAERMQALFERDIFPWLGTQPIAAVTAPELLTVVRRIEKRGAVDTAHRALSNCGRVFRYAIATGRAERDPSADLRGALPPVKGDRFAAITEPKRIGELLRAIDGYVGQPSTVYALKLAPLLFVRPGELRWAEWDEFELDGAHPEWRIPAGRMKMGEEHLIPLCRQAVVLLRELHPISSGRLLFPSLRSAARPISDNTLNAALRRLGYAGDEQVAHGFRAIASTLLNELGWHPDLIELQLAHKERNAVRAAYNRAQRLEERRKMMQAWADYLDGLKAGKRDPRT